MSGSIYKSAWLKPGQLSGWSWDTTPKFFRWVSRWWYFLAKHTVKLKSKQKGHEEMTAHPSRGTGSAFVWVVTSSSRWQPSRTATPPSAPSRRTPRRRNARRQRSQCRGPTEENSREGDENGGDVVQGWKTKATVCWRRQDESSSKTSWRSKI